MLKTVRFLLPLLALGLLAVGCSHDDNVVAPVDKPADQLSKDGTETLGDPTITIAGGSGIVHAGTGMVTQPSDPVVFDVPGTAINQVLMYWSGGAVAPNQNGDDTIEVDAGGGPVSVAGTLIGGPAFFYNFGGSIYFTAYRADITGMGLVSLGANSLVFSGMDYIGGSVNENSGVGLIVIYDDGTSSEIGIKDGLDLAYFDFPEPRATTVPQIYTFAADDVDRTAKLIIMAGSVVAEPFRPNEITVTTSAGVQSFPNLLGSTCGADWDCISLTVDIPAGVTEATVEVISTPSHEPQGASLSWVVGAMSVQEPLYCIGDYVWHDIDMDGCQHMDEMGIEGVTVNLWSGCPPVAIIATDVTDADGMYLFCELPAGEYTVQFVAPDDHVFTEQYAVGCDSANDSNAGSDGITDCITLVDADDLTIDAGLYIPVPAEACRVTGGCRDTYVTDFGIENYSCGGQAGAPTADQPQPWGEWTHTQRQGPSGSFTFHAGTASAPPETEIDWIECMDPGWCVQARPAPAKQIDFAGVGTFKNMGPDVPASISDYVVLRESLHWFEVNVDDLGEPGRAGTVDPPVETCDPLGFGLNGGTPEADCECPDFYRIRIYSGPDDQSTIIYEVYGYIDRGNFQIHPEIH